MEMIKSRNQSSHTYEEATAKKIVENIVNIYYNIFLEFKINMTNLLDR